MQKYLTEFLGSFSWILLIGMIAAAQFGDLTILITGLGYLGLLYLGSRTSGSHYNPAITLAVWLTGRITAKEAGIYMLIQLVAGILAAGLVKVLALDQSFQFAYHPAGAASLVQVLVMEAVFMAILAGVFVQTTLDSQIFPSTSMPWAVAGTWVAITYASASISGGVFNPILGIGANLWAQSFADMWIYAVGPLVGAGLVGLGFLLGKRYLRY
ncbi:aquaporin [Pontibacter sp. G13]|uniref:aquaporin n=1 Tax=Pontibacter sp. G13 TaxID=3074898 RepID=UPI00288A7DC6|nr:aquaporin [Pontibacter sp. G13]WNJ21211.1 aquaporin [Pontibacter sp. G13]